MPRRDDRPRDLRQRVDYWSERLHVPAPRVRVRDMTRKWGSCSTAGTITLATDLGNQDVGFQNFVIAHELLHLRVPNHGKLFKALMTAHVPDWKTYDVDRKGRHAVCPSGRTRVVS
jgi:predicted metal-dependent hydrolase